MPTTHLLVRAAQSNDILLLSGNRVLGLEGVADPGWSRDRGRGCADLRRPSRFFVTGPAAVALLDVDVVRGNEFVSREIRHD